MTPTGIGVFLCVVPGSGESHIQTSGVIEEADALVLIGPHTGQDDEVFLPALKCIHTCDFHLLWKEYSWLHNSSAANVELKSDVSQGVKGHVILHI